MTRKSEDAWLTLKCPRCGARFRIKTAYAHLRGRCPECAYRIEAPRPRPPAFKPAPAMPTDSGSLELLPGDEEWPEPGRVEVDEGGEYGLAQASPNWSKPAAGEPAPPAVEGYGLSDKWEQPAKPQAPRIEETYGVEAPHGERPEVSLAAEVAAEEPAQRLSRAERNPVRAPPPPAHPLRDGVYGLPWNSAANIGVWLAITVGLSIVLVFGAASAYLVPLLLSWQFQGALIMGTLGISVVALAMTGAFAGPAFLAVVQETAAGNDEIQWPQEGLVERFFQLGYLLWLTVLAAWPFGVVASVAPASLTEPGYLIALAFVPVLLFPIFFLSSMSAEKAIVFLHPRALVRLVRHFDALAFVYLVSAVMMTACVYLIYRTVIQIEYWLTPVTAGLCAASLLIYARLLGRLAWLMIRQEQGEEKSETRNSKSETNP